MNKLKNFIINKILRHIAENPKLNKATNWLTIIPAIILALLNNSTDWAKLLTGDTGELIKLGTCLIGTVILWFTGKFPKLKDWLPTAQEILTEVEKELKEEKSK